MKILEIIPQLHMGGAERFTVDLSNELTRQGHEVTLIVTNPITKFGHFTKYLEPGIRLISMDKKAGPDPLLFIRLPNLVRKIKPDVVHTHLGAILYNILTPYVYPPARYFHTIHNTAEKEATTGGRISALARKWLFRQGRTLGISISEDSLNSFRRYYGEKIPTTLIYNGVPDITAHPERVTEFSKQSINIVNVARVMPQKNQIELVKAVEHLNSAGHNVRLYIIGSNDTPEGLQLKSMCSPHSILLGAKDNPRDYMAASDAFILSSLYEGMPLTLIESFCSGTIPIGTPAGGIVNMIKDGVNGILANGYDAKALEEALLRFIDLSNNDRDNMRKEAKASYAKYSMTRCADAYIRLFSK